MGVESVSCPTCGAAVRIGLPRGSEVREVESGRRSVDAETTKVRPLSCPEGHDLSVEFSIG